MQKQFELNILSKQLFNKTHKLLVAVSGGVDSVVLSHLLKQAGFNFSIAHCNFQLREKDSDLDETFCKTLAEQLNVPFFVTRFNVQAYCIEHKQSIQMAARNLRYSWFNELLTEQPFDYLLTAHHANDTVETVFINLLRGTGIKGLKGIPQQNGNIIRPLLNSTKEEIISYATQHNLQFRTDKSNLSDKYERNFLRLNIIPKLKELNPGLEQTFIENSFRFAQEDAIVTEFLTKKAKDLAHEKDGYIHIDKAALKAENYRESILHFLLSPYGFNQTQQGNILENISANGTVGKLFKASGYQLTIDRDALVIKPNSAPSFQALTISSVNELAALPIFKSQYLNTFSLPSKNDLIINIDQLIFPLTMRTKKTGDKLQPFGMSKFKLVSDLLKEEKLNAFDKENCKLLINGNGDIIWVIGYKTDNRYKIANTDLNLLKLSFIER